MEQAQLMKEQFFQKLDRKSKQKQLHTLICFKKQSDNLQIKQKQQVSKQFSFMEREVAGLDTWTAHLLDHYVRPAEKRTLHIQKQMESSMTKQVAPSV